MHLDFAVENIEAAAERAQVYGRLALMSDPFGHGFCFLEFKPGGYDLLTPPHKGNEGLGPNPV